MKWKLGDVKIYWLATIYMKPYSPIYCIYYIPLYPFHITSKYTYMCSYNFAMHRFVFAICRRVLGILLWKHANCHISPYQKYTEIITAFSGLQFSFTAVDTDYLPLSSLLRKPSHPLFWLVSISFQDRNNFTVYVVLFQHQIHSHNAIGN